MDSSIPRMSHLSRPLPLERRDSLLEVDMPDLVSLRSKLSTSKSHDGIEEEHEGVEDFDAMSSFANTEDYLFDAMSEGTGKVYLSRFVKMLFKVGLRKDDVRLRESMSMLKKAQKKVAARGKDVGLDRETFKECISPNIVLIKRAYERDFVIPDFDSFCVQIEHIYKLCTENTSGQVASYIPQLAQFDPNYWGVSVCSTDGQRYSLGDVSIPFCLQSTSKALNYAIVLHDLGEETVHQYVGQEPSGGSFNEIKLDNTRKPHNAMINAGAIVTVSLLKTESRIADRFDYISKQYRRMTGGEFIGFNNSVYLSERETADRNFALGHYMQENDCFPKGAKLKETLDFYFQLCSVEVTADSAAVIAATLANGGLNPLTGEQVVNPEAVRNTLALMHSCGMYDYSGQFAFKVGLPAKSGVSGVILLVIPNVVGICLWSPPLDKCGNSVRGIQFCEQLVDTFNFHMYDNLVHTREKRDPRRHRQEKGPNDMFTLLNAASIGDEQTLCRMYLSGIDMKISDYDGRTALHIAAAQGHISCVKMLLEKFDVFVNPKDRWDHTPLEEAITFGHRDVQKYLEAWLNDHPE